MNRQVRDRGTGMRLTERTRKLIPQGEAYLKERSVMCNEDDVGGRARVIGHLVKVTHQA